ncbi:MAG: hypothetical protein ACI8PT_003085 [Gammaproteobacteria bacterium]|jgi:hypothetical protein
MKWAWSSPLLAVLLLVSVTLQADSHKRVVGAIERVFIEEANLSFVARVDTGAKTSSIHAEKIEVDSPGDPRGKPASFYLVTTQGHSRRIEIRVTSVVRVKTSERSEHRYVVLLRMKWNDSKKTVLVSLNDRSSMNYRLLLGRNWLRGDFIVDFDKNSQD